MPVGQLRVPGGQELEEARGRVAEGAEKDLLQDRGVVAPVDKARAARASTALPIAPVARHHGAAELLDGNCAGTGRSSSA